MSFRYVASTKKGQIKTGVSDLASRESVIRDLETRGLVVVSVDKERVTERIEAFGALLSGTIRHIDKVLFTKHLSIMLKAGLTLLESLLILKEQAPNWRFRLIIGRIAQQVERGGAFSDALESYPRVFSAFYVNIVRAGELSGTLEQSLDHLAVQFTKDYELRSRVRSAMLYPAVVVVAALTIGFFFAIYVLPQVAQLFAGLKGIKLPLVTVILIDVARFARKYTVQSLVGGLAAVAAFLWLLRQKFMRPITGWLVLRLPIVGKITRNLNLARFALVFGTMLKSGIPITKAVEVTADVLGNYYYKRLLLRALGDLQQGKPLSEGLRRDEKLFPKITTRMVEVGEHSGKLEEVLGYLTDFYDLEVETTMKNLTAILEPVLLLIIGAFALALAFAIIIPIYNFIGMISKL